MRFLAALVLSLVLLVACGQESIPVPQPVTKKTTVQPAPQIPDPDYQYSTDEGLNRWRDWIANDIDSYLRVSGRYTPEVFAALANGIRLSPDTVRAKAKVDSAIWHLNQPSSLDYGTREEAVISEANSREYDAGMIYGRLGDTISAKRCVAKLEQEKELTAAFEISLLTGDVTLIDRLTGQMIKANYQTRLVTAAKRSALDLGRDDIWRRVIANVELEPTIVDNWDEIAMSGADLKLFDRWFAGGVSEPEAVAGIVRVSGYDKTKALEYARHYLSTPNVFVFVWYECGEGCYLQPVVGTMELYQLVAHDQELSRLYLDHLAENVARFIPPPPDLNKDGNGGDAATETHQELPGGFGADIWGLLGGPQGQGNYLWSLLSLAHESRDQRLIAAWKGHLVTIGQHYPMEREVGRLILGLSANPRASDLTSDDQIALTWITTGRFGYQPLLDVSQIPEDQDFPNHGSLLNFAISYGEVVPEQADSLRATLQVDPRSEKNIGLKYALVEAVGYKTGYNIWSDRSVRATKQGFERSLCSPFSAAQLNQKVRLAGGSMVFPSSYTEASGLVVPEIVRVRHVTGLEIDLHGCDAAF
jgi:hypothetical protein